MDVTIQRVICVFAVLILGLLALPACTQDDPCGQRVAWDVLDFVEKSFKQATLQYDREAPPEIYPHLNDETVRYVTVLSDDEVRVQYKVDDKIVTEIYRVGEVVEGWRWY